MWFLEQARHYGINENTERPAFHVIFAVRGGNCEVDPPTLEFLRALNPTDSDLDRPIRELQEAVRDDLQEMRARGSSSQQCRDAENRINAAARVLRLSYADVPYDLKLRTLEFWCDLWVALNDLVIERGNLDELLAEGDDEDEDEED